MKFALVMFAAVVVGCEVEDIVSEEDIMEEVCGTLGHLGYCDPINCPAPFEPFCPEASPPPETLRCQRVGPGEPRWMVGLISGGCQVVECGGFAELNILLDAKVREIRRFEATVYLGNLADVWGEIEIQWINPEGNGSLARMIPLSSAIRPDEGKIAVENIALPGEVWVQGLAVRLYGAAGQAFQLGIEDVADIDVGHSLCSPWAFPFVGSVYVIE